MPYKDQTIILESPGKGYNAQTIVLNLPTEVTTRSTPPSDSPSVYFFRTPEFLTLQNWGTTRSTSLPRVPRSDILLIRTSRTVLNWSVSARPHFRTVRSYGMAIIPQLPTTENRSIRILEEFLAVLNSSVRVWISFPGRKVVTDANARNPDGNRGLTRFPGSLKRPVF
ncbi:MAG: hypothetical protein JWM68_5384 [Verrucomicrobiales bacterium]|nr:hypothetical protein [Verrucomicrobiales bacterium]